MRIGTAQKCSTGLAVVLCAAVGLTAQQPAPAPPATAAPVARSPVVDPAAHDRGRALWASHCIDCHGAQARGSDTGPNIIRTKIANYDRSAPQAGSVLGPFLKAGHPTQSKKPSASFTDEEIAALANFLRQRINDTMRGSPIFTVGDIVTGNAKAGEAFFNGDGGCAKCHNASERSLAGDRHAHSRASRSAAADAVPRRADEAVGAVRAARRLRPAHQRRRRRRIAMPSPCRSPPGAAHHCPVSSWRRAIST